LPSDLIFPALSASKDICYRPLPVCWRTSTGTISGSRRSSNRYDEAVLTLERVIIDRQPLDLLIPRSDVLLLGGTFKLGDYTTHAEPEETARIVTAHWNLFAEFG
jgi:hypothetical protein